MRVDIERRWIGIATSEVFHHQAAALTLSDQTAVTDEANIVQTVRCRVSIPTPPTASSPS